VTLIDRQVFFTHAPDAGLRRRDHLGDPGSDVAAVLWIDGEFGRRQKSASFVDAGSGGGLPGPEGRVRLGRALARRRFEAEWLELELIPRRKRRSRGLLDGSPAAWRASRRRGGYDLGRDEQGWPRELHNIWSRAGQHNLAAYSSGVAVGRIGGTTAAATRDEAKKTGDASPEFAEQVRIGANISRASCADQVMFQLNDSDESIVSDSPRIVIVTHGAAVDKAAAAAIHPV
jgi:hypothetical protein